MAHAKMARSVHNRMTKFSGVLLFGLLSIFLAASVVFAQGRSDHTAQSGKSLKVSYEFPAPRITESGDYHSVMMEGLDRFGEPGLPVLPYKTAKILLPFDTEVRDIKITCTEKITLPGSYVIEPGQQPVPIGFKGQVKRKLPAEEVYGASTPFPEKRHGKRSLGCKKGYKFVVLNLYPVEYSPLDGLISYYPEMTVRVYTTAAPAHEKKYLPPRSRRSAREIKGIKRLVDNPELIDAHPSMRGNSG